MAEDRLVWRDALAALEALPEEQRAVLLLVGRQLAAVGSDLLGALTLGPDGWIVLVALPLLFVALAALAARLSVTATLRRTL